MTSKGLKLHKSRMHEKSLERIERERKQQFKCDQCDIKRNTEILLKSHMKQVHGFMKRNLSEMKRGTKTTRSPPSLSPPNKKVKEDEITIDKDDLESIIEQLRIPKPKRPEHEVIEIQKKEIDNLNTLLTASGEVIANLEDENNHLNAKAEFYEEVAESLVTENESLLLKLQQLEEQRTHDIKMPSGKRVSFNLDLEQEGEEEEEDEAEGEEDLDREEIRKEDENIEAEAANETGFRKQSRKVTCIVCGCTRNTKNQMNNHMEKHKKEGDIIPPGQIHCGLQAFPECPYQCTKKEDLMQHIETEHAKKKCDICSETFETKQGLDKHINIKHPRVEQEVNRDEGQVLNDPTTDNDLTENRFNCPVCGLTKTSKSQIESHMSSHDKDTEDVRHKCEICPYQTINKNHLVEHIEREHIKENNLDLTFKQCKLKFRNTNQLNTHMKNKHNTNYKPCRNFPSNNCEYGEECNFSHIVLK